MPLTEQEKVSIRHHCGYLNVGEAYTFVLGTPAAVETQFIIEGAMTRVLESALPQVRRHLRILDQIEEQMVEDLELAAVNQLGEIQVNQKEQSQLWKNYVRWVGSLCNLFGVYRNPFDKRGGGGVNISVG